MMMMMMYIYIHLKEEEKTDNLVYLLNKKDNYH